MQDHSILAGKINHMVLWIEFVDVKVKKFPHDSVCFDLVLVVINRACVLSQSAVKTVKFLKPNLRANSFDWPIFGLVRVLNEFF